MLFEYASPSTNSVRPTNCGPTARLRLLYHSHTLCAQVSTTSLQDTPGPPAHPGGTTTNAEHMCAMHVQLLWAPAEPHACVAHAKKRPNLCMPPARPLGTACAQWAHVLLRAHAAQTRKDVAKQYVIRLRTVGGRAHLLQRQQGLGCPPERLRCNLVADLTHLQGTAPASASAA